MPVSVAGQGSTVSGNNNLIVSRCYGTLCKGATLTSKTCKCTRVYTEKDTERLTDLFIHQFQYSQIHTLTKIRPDKGEDNRKSRTNLTKKNRTRHFRHFNIYMPNLKNGKWYNLRLIMTEICKAWGAGHPEWNQVQRDQLQPSRFCRPVQCRSLFNKINDRRALATLHHKVQPLRSRRSRRLQLVKMKRPDNMTTHLALSNWNRVEFSAGRPPSACVQPKPKPSLASWIASSNRSWSRSFEEYSGKSNWLKLQSWRTIDKNKITLIVRRRGSPAQRQNKQTLKHPATLTRLWT